MSPSTPSGRRSRSTRLPGSALWGIAPSTRLPSSAAMRKNSMSSPTSTSASAFSGLPWSSVSTLASSSARLSMTSAARWRNSARSKPVRAPHDGKAALAAAMARRASARSPSATGPSDSPVAGLVASTVAPLVASRHSPSMNIRVIVAARVAMMANIPAASARVNAGHSRLPPHAPFDSLDEETLGRVAESAEIEFCAARSSIFESPGLLPEHGYVVRSGAVELLIDGRLLDLIGEGEMFGFTSLLSEEPLDFVARAAEDALVYRIPADVMRPVLERPAFVRFVTQ